MRKYLLGVLLVAAITAACSSNSCARNYGGTMTVDLPKGAKLVTCTWKEEGFWYLTRPMRADEAPETYRFQEKSPMGVREGTVILKESR